MGTDPQSHRGQGQLSPPGERRSGAPLEGGGRLEGVRWRPVFWHGMGLKAWSRLALDNRLAVTPRPSYLWCFVSISLISILNSLGRGLTDLVYRRQLRQSQPRPDPIVILGHWRSGTTFLHELLMLDPRHAAPTTFQCFVPGHFPITEAIFQRFLGWLLPSRRPMDNIMLGWDSPQEDEFAIMNLGAPSPYRRIAFPNNIDPEPSGLDLMRLSPAERQHWKQALTVFLRRVTLKEPRRLILKSPTHTARISTLLAMFPEARFIHIVRNPYAVVPSTKRTWQALHHTQSLQAHLTVDLETQIFNDYHEMRQAYKRDSQLLSPSQLCELRYEDLVQNPIEAIRSIYHTLQLGDFSIIERALMAKLPAIRDYRVNNYQLAPQIQDRISQECHDTFEAYGYPIRPTAPAGGAG